MYSTASAVSSSDIIFGITVEVCHSAQLLNRDTISGHDKIIDEDITTLIAV